MRRWRRILALGLRACASRSGRTGRRRKYTMCVTYRNRTTTTAASSSSWASEGARRAAAAPARGPRRRAPRAASRGRPSRRAGRGGAGRAARPRASTTYCLCWLRPCLLYRRAVRRIRTDLRRRTSGQLASPSSSEALARQTACRGPVAARCTDATRSVVLSRSAPRNCLPCAVQFASKASVSIR